MTLFLHNLRVQILYCSSNDIIFCLVDPNPDPDPEGRGCLDTGDGVLDMMLKPTLTTYESKEDAKSNKDDDDD